MTFLADEGVDRQIVERLRLDGHEVSYVAEMAPGIMDEVVLRESRDSSSVLITADKDFGELVFRQRQASTGVLLVRLWVLSWTGHEGLGGLCRHSGTWARIAWGQGESVAELVAAADDAMYRAKALGHRSGRLGRWKLCVPEPV